MPKPAPGSASKVAAVWPFRSGFTLRYPHRDRREAMAERVNVWAELTRLQTGRYGEYFAKMALVRAGFDVFSPEVDDKGIDFVLRADGDTPSYYDVQVKTVRSRNTYVFMRKEKFRLRPNLLLALVVLDGGSEPEIYLIPPAFGATPGRPSPTVLTRGRSQPRSMGSGCRRWGGRHSSHSALPEEYPTATIRADLLTPPLNQRFARAFVPRGSGR
jgi:hypothetical protein